MVATLKINKKLIQKIVRRSAPCGAEISQIGQIEEIMRNITLKALSLNSRGYAARRTYGFGYAVRRTYGFNAPAVGMTVKPSPINSRGYAFRRTYGNNAGVIELHAEGVPQQRRWATPSGSMSRVMRPLSVGSANPRLLIGDRVAVIGGGGSDLSVGRTDPRLLIGDRVAVICPKTFPTTQHHK